VAREDIGNQKAAETATEAMKKSGLYAHFF